MKTILIETKPCPQCGRPLPATPLAGLCPACLLAQGTDTSERPELPKSQPPPIERIKTLFPQLKIVPLLGAGGRGAVYKPPHPALDRLIVLKIFPASTSAEG